MPVNRSSKTLIRPLPLLFGNSSLSSRPSNKKNPLAILWNRLVGLFRSPGKAINKVISRLFGGKQAELTPVTGQLLVEEAATHELGHLLIALLLRKTPSHISVTQQKINNTFTAAGHVEYSRTLKTPTDYLDEILIGVAGGLTSGRYFASSLEDRGLNPEEKKKYYAQWRFGPKTDLASIRDMLIEAKNKKLFEKMPGFQSFQIEPISDIPEEEWTIEYLKDVLNTWEYPIVHQAQTTVLKVLHQLPTPTIQAMVSDLVKRKQLTSPVEIQTFFDKYLGKDFDWASLQKPVEEYRRFILNFGLEPKSVPVEVRNLGIT